MPHAFMLLCDQGCVQLHQNPFSSSVVVLSCFQRASEDRHIQYCVGWTPGRQTPMSEEVVLPLSSTLTCTEQEVPRNTPISSPAFPSVCPR